MKVSELIKQLQSCDPNSEVVVNNAPIYFIEELGGYYDGSYQKLIQNQSKSPYYNIEGIEFTREGSKVRLNVMNFEDVIWNTMDTDSLDKLKFEFHNSLSSQGIEEKKKMVKNEMDECRSALKKLLGDKDEN